jgi:hypothetical protein
MASDWPAPAPRDIARIDQVMARAADDLRRIVALYRSVRARHPDALALPTVGMTLDARLCRERQRNALLAAVVLLADNPHYQADVSDYEEGGTP